MDYAELYDNLSGEFPREALHVDASRGKKTLLVGAKVGWVIDWLNKKLGICGVGWRFAYSTPEIQDDKARTYVLVQFRVDGEDAVNAATFGKEGGVKWLHGSNRVWSEPIISVGEQPILYGRVGDAIKGAVSHGLSKAASYMGVAIDNYKGMYTVEDDGETITRTDGSAQEDLIEGLIMALADVDPDLVEGFRDEYGMVDEIVKGKYHLGLHNYIEAHERVGAAYEEHKEAILQGQKFSALTVGRVLAIYKALHSYQNDEDMTEEDVLSLLTENQPADEPDNVIED